MGKNKAKFVDKAKVQIILSLLSFPIVSLPLIFKEIYRGKYSALSFLAIFMGLLAYMWAPTGDLYRYYLDYLEMGALSWKDFPDILQFDFVHPMIMFIFSQFGIYFGFVRFTLCIISYLLVFSVYKDAVANSNWLVNNRDRIIAFIILFFLLRFSAFLTGVRYTFALALCIYGAYFLMYADKKKGWIVLIMSACTHFSMWVVVLLVVLIQIFKLRMKRWIFLTLISVLLLSASTLLIWGIDQLPLSQMFKTHLENYTTGYWASGELDNSSFKHRIAQILSICGVYVSFIFFISRQRDNKHFELFSLLCILLALLWNMNSAFNRYAGIAIVFFIIPFIRYGGLYFNRKHLKIFLFISIIVYAASIYTFKRDLKYGKQLCILYSPLPIILTNTYSDNWILSNITEDGGFVVEQ